jgi:hypothetical protein
MPSVSDDLRREAVEAFHAYEKVVVERLMRRPEWRIDAKPLHDVLATGNEQKVREFIADVRRGRDDVLNSIVV